MARYLGCTDYLANSKVPRIFSPVVTKRMFNLFGGRVKRPVAQIEPLIWRDRLEPLYDDHITMVARSEPPPLNVAGLDPNSFPPGEPAQLAANDPAVLERLPIVTQGPHTLGSIIRGCKVWVERVNEPDPRRAEILSVREKAKPRLRRDAASLTPSVDGDVRDVEATESRLEYYLHYVAYNKRLDEWVPGSRILVDREVEWPLPPVSTGPTPTPLVRSSLPGGATPALSSGSSTPARAATPPVRRVTDGSFLRKAALRAAGQKRRRPPDDEGEEDDHHDGEGDAEREEDEQDEGDGSAFVQVEMVDEDADAEGELDTPDESNEATGVPFHFSKAQEIEKLRTQGSMTQSVHEIARVKNLDRIQIGKHEVEAWYFSPYPVE